MTATQAELELLGDVQVGSYDLLWEHVRAGRAVTIGERVDGAYTWAVSNAA